MESFGLGAKVLQKLKNLFFNLCFAETNKSQQDKDVVNVCAADEGFFILKSKTNEDYPDV